MTDQDIKDVISKRKSDMVSCRVNYKNLFNLIFYTNKEDRSFAWVINKALENYFINKKAPSQR